MAAIWARARALRTGIRAARHDIVVTMDGDGQNDPADIHLLLAPFAERDAAAGRWWRASASSGRTPASQAHRLASSPTGCGAGC